jgi:hypothetical protein
MLEPLPRRIARLTESKGTGVVFGHEVEHVVNEKDEAKNSPWRGDAKASGTCPTPLSGDIRQWLFTTLSRGGVFAAVPGEHRGSSRIMALAHGSAAGTATWWSSWLCRTAFGAASSGQFGDRSVYRLGGEAAGGFDFFPSGAAYGLVPGHLPKLLHYGLAAELIELDASGASPVFDTQLQQQSVSMFAHLEAAANGIAPPLFACYAITDAPLPEPGIAPDSTLVSSGGSHIRAVISISQAHTFTLDDAMAAFESMDVTDNTTAARESIGKLLDAVSSKLQALARLKVLKVNCTAQTIVFCPELVDDGDDWELKGHSLRTRAHSPTRGQPFVTQFDGRLTKRLGAHDGFDSNAAFATSLAVLLSDAKRYPRAHAVAIDRLTPMLNAAIKASEGSRVSFIALLRRTLRHTRTERTPLPAVVLDAIISDVDTVLSGGTATFSELVTFNSPTRSLQRILSRSKHRTKRLHFV